MIDTFTTCFDDGAIGSALDVATKPGVAELHADGLDGEGVAVAIIDGGINLDYLEQVLGFRPAFDAVLSWRQKDVVTMPGAFPVGHGTMCAYAVLLAAPNSH